METSRQIQKAYRNIGIDKKLSTCITRHYKELLKDEDYIRRQLAKAKARQAEIDKAEMEKK